MSEFTFTYFIVIVSGHSRFDLDFLLLVLTQIDDNVSYKKRTQLTAPNQLSNTSRRLDIIIKTIRWQCNSAELSYHA